jgi:hypothetical protein
MIASAYSYVVQKLRQRRAGVPEHRQLQGTAETVPLFPPALNDVEVRTLKGVQAGELVPVSGNAEQLLPLRVAQKFMPRHFAPFFVHKRSF